MRKIAGCSTWTGYKTNTVMAKELNITPVLNKIRDYKRNWMQHTNELPRIIEKKTTDQQVEEIGGDHKETSRRVRSGRINRWPSSC